MQNTISLKTVDWGLISYAQAWEQQTSYFNALLSAKATQQEADNLLIVCEHPPVYTLGKSGKAQNMLLSEQQLEAIQATLFQIDRGGDITFHGPGQIVAYPILNLEAFQLGLKSYIHLLEEAVIRVCASYGIAAERLSGATGVWISAHTPQARKICAIGVRSSRYITMHGLAFNVNTDLRYFSYIHPCGFVDKGVTSLEKELGRKLAMGEVKTRLVETLQQLLLSKQVAL